MKQNYFKKLNLKPYLGRYYVDLTRNDVNLLRQFYPELKNYYYVGQKEELLKLGCYFLLNFGWQRYETYNSVELVDRYMGKLTYLEPDEAHTISSDLLIIYHMKYMPSGIDMIEKVINYFVADRAFNNLITIVLSETDLKSVLNNDYLEFADLRCKNG